MPSAVAAAAVCLARRAGSSCGWCVAQVALLLLLPARPQPLRRLLATLTRFLFGQLRTAALAAVLAVPVIAVALCPTIRGLRLTARLSVRPEVKEMREIYVILLQEESMPKTQNLFKMVSRHEKTTKWVFMKNKEKH